MDLQAKWNRASRVYDRVTWAEDQRFGEAKKRLFSHASGKCLMIAAGTGLDFKHFPAGLDITAIDISPAMLEKARLRAEKYPGSIRLLLMDAQALEFEDQTFDTVISSCTFCSVPDPLRALREARRCLRPEGRLLMFEHVRSRVGMIGIMQDLCTPLSRLFGPEMNRDTVENVVRAGFELLEERNVYLDVVKAIAARPPAARQDKHVGPS